MSSEIDRQNRLMRGIHAAAALHSAHKSAARIDSAPVDATHAEQADGR